MAESLGEKLRAAREARGISASEVAEATRISPMYIDSIEKNNYKPLPGGIFNKGFVKSYARFIGFDEQEALRDYARIVAQNEGDELGQAPAYKPEVLTDDRARQSTLPTIIFAGFILALMTGGVLLLVNYVQNHPSAPVAGNTANTSSNGNTTPGSQVPVSSGTAPTMASLKVEFRSTTDPISLSATADGKNSVNTIAPGNSVAFEPKESLRLSYSKSLSASAELLINGKQIKLPDQPENSKRAAIEIEINKDNLERIWTSGQFTYASATPEVTPESVTTPQQEPTQTTPVETPSTEPSASVTPRPAFSPRQTPRPSPTATVRTTPTPIIVGRPTANTSRTPRPVPRTSPN